jgi:hypothetical protein
MKKIISTLLVLAMVACMLPVFAVSTSAASANPQQGLNATFWHTTADVTKGESGHADGIRRLMGWHGKGHSNSYETNEWFDASIDQIVKTSHKWPTVGDGSYTFAQGFDRDSYKAVSNVNSDNEYLVQWTGSMKATAAGTYTFIGNGLDNGVAIFVDGNKAFEWWGPDSWFDKGDNTPLLSKYTFTVTEDQVGKDIPFEMWFLEMFGDERLDMSVTMDGTAEGQKSMSDAGLSFSLSATYYTYLLNGSWGQVNDLLIPGDGKDAGNAANHTFSEDQLSAIKGKMMNVGTTLIADMESNTFFEKKVFEQFGAHYNGFMIEYEGYLTPTVSGNYTFGTQKVDNCFIMQLEIDGTWKTVYEFWGKGIWNDSSTTYYNESFDLTAGTSYKLRAIFLEIDGGEPLVTSYKIDGKEFGYSASGILLTTEAYKPGTAPITKSLFDLGSEWKYQLGTWNGAAPAAPAGWPNAIADTMLTGTAPMHDEWTTNDAAPADGTQENAYIWLAKEFTVEDLKALDGLSLMADMNYDDDIEVYLNGTLVYDHSRWSGGVKRYKLTEDAAELLKEGKNIIAVSLIQHWGGWDFDMGLCASNVNADNMFPQYTAISNADEFIAYANLVNEFNAKDTNITHSANAYITKDIDMSGKVYTPINRYLGTIHGNGKTISNITYITDATGGNKGLIVNDLANFWQDNYPTENGTIMDLTIQNGLIVAPKTEWNAVGAIAGKMDRGCIYNCHVVDTTVIGGDWTGGIVGRSESGSINGALESPVLNCSIKNSTVIGSSTPTNANKAIGAIVGTNDSRSKLLLGDYVIENVVIMCDESWSLKAEVVGAPDTSEGCAPVHGEKASVKNVQIVNTAAAAVTKGAESEWAGEGDVKITVSSTDNSITAVKVGGKALPTSAYSMKETAEKVTVVTIKAKYLRTLELGDYTVSIESYEGNTEAKFTVVEGDPIDPAPTGDSVAALVVLTVVSLLGMAVISKKRK